MPYGHNEYLIDPDSGTKYCETYVIHEVRRRNSDGDWGELESTDVKILTDKRPTELKPFVEAYEYFNSDYDPSHPYIKGTKTPGITPQRAIFNYLGTDYEVPIQGISEDAVIEVSGYHWADPSWYWPQEIYTRRDVEEVHTCDGKVFEKIRFHIAHLYLNRKKYSLFFRLEFNAAALTSHMLASLTAKLQGFDYYFLDEQLPISVIANYTDGTTVDVSSVCTLSSAVATTGRRTTISYTNTKGETASTILYYSVTYVKYLEFTALPTKTVYYEGDLFDPTGAVITAYFRRYSDDREFETRDVTAEATFNRTGEFITKSNNSVRAYYEYNGESDYTEVFRMTVYNLNGITVTTPFGTRYRTGSTMHYTNMKVLANYEDGTSQDITADVVCMPADGAIATPSANTVTVSYTKGNKTVTTSFSQTIITLSNLEFSSLPNKVAYKVGEELDYSGIDVQAVFTDGHKIDVTRHCIYSLSDGTIITSTQLPIVSYTHNSGEVLTAAVPITIASLDSLTVTDPRIYNLGDVIDYDSVTVTANYSDETSEDVTSEVSYDIPDGGTVTKTTQRNITVTYDKATGVSITGVLALKIRIIKQLEITLPTKTSYNLGEKLDLTGMIIRCRYTDETYADVTSLVSLNVEDGAFITDTTPSVIIATYTEGTETVTAQFEIEINQEE